MPFSEKEQVQRQEIVDKINELKIQIKKVQADFNPAPFESEIAALTQSLKTASPSSDEERKLRTTLKDKQAILNIWKGFSGRSAHLDEMIELVAPDLRGLDEDRCNWLIIAEELDELEKDILKVSNFAKTSR